MIKTKENVFGLSSESSPFLTWWRNFGSTQQHPNFHSRFGFYSLNLFCLMSSYISKLPPIPLLFHLVPSSIESRSLLCCFASSIQISSSSYILYYLEISHTKYKSPSLLRCFASSIQISSSYNLYYLEISHPKYECVTNLPCDMIFPLNKTMTSFAALPLNL